MAVLRQWCKFMNFSGYCQSKNGIICGAAMAEKTLENNEMRYSAAYPTGAGRFHEAI